MNQPHVVIFSIALSLSCVPFLEIVSVVALLRCYTMNSRSPHATQVDPLYAFTFIRTFLNILIEYFGEVTAPVLRDNFDIVHQLLEETLDAGGHPLTTAPNALRDIVLPPSLISKILSVTGVSGPSGPTTNNLSAFSSPIPWRKAGLRYNHNDIYFDIVETLDAVVNK